MQKRKRLFQKGELRETANELLLYLAEIKNFSDSLIR